MCFHFFSIFPGEHLTLLYKRLSRCVQKPKRMATRQNHWRRNYSGTPGKGRQITPGHLINISALLKLADSDFSYGKMGEAVSRYRKTTITTDDSKALKSSLHALCKSDDQLIAEGDLIGHELSSLKSEQDDSKPVHIAVAILQNAKLLFLR